VRSNSLLPRNASDLERSIEQALELNLPVKIADLWHPARCPAVFLPLLAVQYGDPYFDRDWSESIQRQVLADSFANHQIRGTRKALINALAPFGKVAMLTEWFTTSGDVGTFSLELALTDRGVNTEDVMTLTRIINDVKPVSRHLAGLFLSLATIAPLRAAPHLHAVYSVKVKPLRVKVINQQLLLKTAAACYCLPRLIVIKPHQ